MEEESARTGEEDSRLCYSTSIKAVTAALRWAAGPPTLASRLGHVCSKQRFISARPRPGSSWLRRSRSSFKEAWKTYRKSQSMFSSKLTGKTF